MKNNKTNQVGVRLDDKDYNKLKSEADNKGMSMSNYIRFILDEHNHINRRLNSIIESYSYALVELKRSKHLGGDPTDYWIKAGRVMREKEFILLFIDDNDPKLLDSIKEAEEFYKELDSQYIWKKVRKNDLGILTKRKEI